MDRKYAVNRFCPIWGFGVIPLVFLGIFYFYPVLTIFLKSFSGRDGVELTAFIQVAHSKRLWGIIWFSFWQALVSTVFTLAAGLPCAYVIATYSFRFKKALLVLCSIPFVLPTVVVAAAFQAWIGENGLFPSNAFSHPVFMIILAHVFYNVSVVIRIVSGFWSRIRRQYGDAASVMGADPVRVFFYIHLPLLRPAIFAAGLLVYIFCFCSFGVVMILGGPGYSTIEVEIYRQAAHMFNLPVAAALSFIQIGFTFFLMWIYTLFQKRTVQFVPESENTRYQSPKTAGQIVLLYGCIVLLVGLTVLPLAALVFRSMIHDGHPSLIFYRTLFTNATESLFYISPVQAMKNSLLFSCITLVLAGIVGLASAYTLKYSGRKAGTLLDPVFMLPLSTSAVTLGFGIIVSLDSSFLDIRSSPVLIPIAHSIVAFPFVFRSVLPAIRSVPGQLKDAAAVMGANPFKSWYCIELPLILKAVTVGSVFAFTISLGEFGATVFTARPEYSTMPMAIFRYLGTPGSMNYGQAMAVSTLLMLTCAAGFVVIEKMSGRNRDIF